MAPRRNALLTDVLTEMSVRPYRNIARRKSRQVYVGSVAVGGDAPISIQSMTNTLTTDVAATVSQVKELEEAGADIVRISCPDEASSAALREIVRQVDVPIVADIHFHYKRAIEAAESGASCLRINPGNIGDSARVREVVKAASDHGCSMRIGVNAGSIAPEYKERFGEDHTGAIAQCAIDHCELLDEVGFHDYLVSIKDSDPRLVIEANHCPEMLERDTKRPWSLKQRIRGRHGHLSNGATLELLRSVESPNWKEIYLVHLSKDCNDVNLVRNSFTGFSGNGGTLATYVVDPTTAEAIPA